MKSAPHHAKMAHVPSHVNFLFVVVILPFVIEVSGITDWHYEGELGLQTWHANYKICAEGKHQSPIDIVTQDAVYRPNLDEVVIWYNSLHPKGQMVAYNDGRTVKIKTVGKFYVAIGNVIFKTDHLHLHWGVKNDNGTEHYINSESFAMELHIVSYDAHKFKTIEEAASKPRGLAVLGVIYKISNTDNPTLNIILDNLEAMQKPGHPKVDVDPQSLRSFLPKDISRFYRYDGSLTTPACYESVIWTIFADHKYISKNQMKKLRDLFYVYDPAKEQAELNKTANVNGTNSKNITTNQFNGTDDNTTDVNDLLRKYRFEMVNNFRPVQNLNDRVVLRSFEILKVPLKDNDKKADENGASNNAIIQPWAGLFLLFLNLWAFG